MHSRVEFPLRVCGAPSMMRRTLAAGFCLALAACGGNPKPQAPATPPAPAKVVAAAPQPPGPAPARPVPDPVASLIASSQNHFEAGETELKAGHLDKARQEFD